MMGPIYVASSWENGARGGLLDVVHAALWDAGFSTLDFRAQGRWWDKAGEDKHPILGRLVSKAGQDAFAFDLDLMRRSAACLAVHPCGIAVALEAGYFAGAGKPMVVWGTPRASLDITWLLANAVLIGEPLPAAVTELGRLLGGGS